MTRLWGSVIFNSSIKIKFANPYKANIRPLKVDYNTDTRT